MFGNQKTGKTLAERSSDALSSFRKTIQDLRDINSEADIIVIQNNETIANLQSENNAMDSLMNENNNVMNNIEKLIGK